jgi:hypothetical protein
MSAAAVSSAAQEADLSHDEVNDPIKRPSEREELRKNLAQLKLGDECLRVKRLLGGAPNQDYETYSLPVSRVSPLPPLIDLILDDANLVDVATFYAR